jgi:hypothetical protein
MRRYLVLVPLTAAVLGLALGCSGTEKAETGAQDEPAATAEATDASQDQVASAKLKVPETQTEMASINTTGTLGCGHCTYEVVNSCALAIKTENGEVYLVDAGDQQEELMAVRYDGPTAAISGRVAEVDGQKVIYTDSVELN